MAAPDPHRSLGVDLEGDEVALVDADHRRARRATARSSSASSWTSTRTSRPSSTASAWRSAQLGVVEGGDDEQHGVGAHQAGVADVARVDGEVLAQHRDGDGARGPPGGRPPSRRTRPRRSAPRGRRLRPARRRGAVAAGSRSGARSPFDGDRRFTSAITASSVARRGAQGGREPARRRRPPGGVEQRRRAARGSARGRGAVALEDAVEVGGHRRARAQSGQVLGLQRREQVHLRRLGQQAAEGAEGLVQRRVLAVGVEGGLVGVDLVEPERPAVALAVEDVLDGARLRRRGVDEASRSAASASSAASGRTVIRAMSATLSDMGGDPTGSRPIGRSPVPPPGARAARRTGATRNIAHDTRKSATAAPSAGGRREQQPEARTSRWTGRTPPPAAARSSAGSTTRPPSGVSSARSASRSSSSVRGVRPRAGAARRRSAHPQAPVVRGPPSGIAEGGPRLVDGPHGRGVATVAIGVVLPGQRDVRLTDLGSRRRRRHPEHLVEVHRAAPGSLTASGGRPPWRWPRVPSGRCSSTGAPGSTERASGASATAPSTAERAEDVTVPTSRRRRRCTVVAGGDRVALDEEARGAAAARCRRGCRCGRRAPGPCSSPS